MKVDRFIQVREQSQQGRSAEADVDEAKQTISDLYGRIVEIKEKAAHSEELVQVICKWCSLPPLTPRSISKLDAAKRNLTESLNALARLQMYYLPPLLTQVHVVAGRGGGAEGDAPVHSGGAQHGRGDAAESLLRPIQSHRAGSLLPPL